MVNDVRPHSHKAKEERESKKKMIEPVAKGKIKKKNKLAEIFISDDASNVKSYILMDVLVPAAKKAISDIVTNGIDMILYGETGKTKSKSNSAYVSYNKMSDRKERTYSSSRTTRRFYTDVEVSSMKEAKRVLNQMDDIIDAYDIVSIADLYELVGLESEITPQDYKYGWTNIRDAEIVMSRDSYVIKMPKAKPID